VSERRIWVLRHAKAASGSPDGEDHSRPLTKRGREQSKQTARHLRDERAAGEPVPQLVLSSSAERALETARLVTKALGAEGDGPVFEVEDDLYGADADEVLELLRSVPEEVSSVMVVGHNPTFAELVELLVTPGDPRTGGLFSFPTCALARIAVPIASWRGLCGGTGKLEELYVPDV
jgi:phosphohistidine phosphatase